jgi:hypothetical protein
MQSASGDDKMASARDYDQIERANIWDNNGRPLGVVRKRVRFIRPNYLRVDQVGPGDTYVLYFDGTSGWEILPDKTVADLKGGELKFAQGYLRAVQGLEGSLADHDPNNIITSPSPNVIDITTKNDPSHKTEITLDPASLVPVKETGISLADPEHPVASETRFEQWHDEGGRKVAGRIIKFHAGKKVAEITVEKTTLNSGLKPADLAAKPPDLKPVIPE